MIFNMITIDKRNLGVLACLLLVVFTVRAETVISDDFSTAGQRSAGDKLNDTATESRNAKWDASPNVVLMENDGKGCVSVKDPMGFYAKVKIPAGFKVIRIEVDARPQEVASGKWKGFFMIGLGRTEKFNINWLGGAYLTLDISGHAAVSYHPPLNDGADPNKGAGVKALKGANIKSFKRDGMNKMVFEYDTESNTISAWVNEELVAEHLALQQVGFTPTLDVMGFSGWALEPNQPLVSNVTVTLK